METIDALRQQLADSQARECAMRIVIERALYALLSVEPFSRESPAMKIDDSVAFSTVKMLRDALSSPALCPHEQRVKELEKQLCAMREALKQVHEGACRQLAEPRNHEEDQYALTVIATKCEEVLSSTAPFPHELRVRELEADLTATRKRLAEFEEHERQTHEAMESIVGNRAEFVELTAELKQERDELREQLKTERERFDWFCDRHNRLLRNPCQLTPDEWRAEIDKARGSK